MAHKSEMQGLWRPGAWGEVDVEAELIDWKQPPAQGLARKLFNIPMAQQRYAFVLNIIKKHRAQSMVDLGCGDGKLLEYLLQQVILYNLPCLQALGSYNAVTELYST